MYSKACVCTVCVEGGECGGEGVHGWVPAMCAEADGPAKLVEG